MTNQWMLRLIIHSPLLRGLLLARCQYLHRFNIVRVGHPTMWQGQRNSTRINNRS